MSLWRRNGDIWVVGCGNMGGALLERWLECGLEPDRVTVVDPAPARISGVTWTDTVPVGQPSLLILGIKPQMLAELAPLLTAAVGKGSVLVSILAGAECGTLRQHFPNAQSIIRSMPNLPARLGKGVTGLFSNDADDALRNDISQFFASNGHVEWLAAEDDFHAIIAVSGSGPAFAYRFIGALADGGTALGLPAEQALRLARATVEGAAALSIASGENPKELARRVTSPNGTTAAGLEALDRDNLFTELILQTLAATAKRSEELAAAAKKPRSGPN